MSLSDVVQMVHDFHRLIGAPISDVPTVISCQETVARSMRDRLWDLSQVAAKTATEHDDLFAARLSLVLEELAEWCDAHAKHDLIRAADSWADRAYVLLGNAVVMGLPADQLLREVHKSNMTKGPGGPNGKGDKSPSYKPPDIFSIIQQARRT